jgi:hypothetical protein
MKHQEQNITSIRGFPQLLVCNMFSHYTINVYVMRNSTQFLKYRLYTAAK